MKILVLQDYLRSGGTERQSCLLANAFAGRGHTTTLLSFRPGGALDRLPSDDVVRLSLQRRDWGWDWFAPGLIRCSRSAVPDIILCMGRMANGYAGWLAKAVPSAAVISTVRTGKALPWPYRRSLRRTRHIVANSEETRRSLTNHYRVPADRVSVIHNALVFPPQSTLTNRDSLRRLQGAGPDTVVLLWVGMFRPEKNHRECLDMVRRLPASPPWQLWLAGDGPTRRDLEQAVAAYGLQSRIKFFGFTPDPSPLYDAADLAVLTSKSESLSNFLIEAHAHGLPSVAYAAAGVPECGGMAVPIGDQRAFLAGLEKRMADPGFRRQEGDRLRIFAREAFSPERQTLAYLALFQRLLAPPS